MNQKISRFFQVFHEWNWTSTVLEHPAVSFAGPPGILRAKAKAARAWKLSIGTTPQNPGFFLGGSFSAQGWWGWLIFPGDVGFLKVLFEKFPLEFWRMGNWSLGDWYFFIHDHSQGKVHIRKKRKICHMDVIGPIHTLLGWESWAEISAIFIN